MTIKERVANILKASSAARNSDTELQIIYMQKSGMNLSDEQLRIFRELPHMETIRRIRQKFQENGEYPADREVEQARYNKYVNTKQNISGTKNPEQYLESLGYRVLPYGE